MMMRIFGSPQSFNRDDVGAVQIGDFSETGKYGFAVQDYGTSSALSLAVTTVLGTGQMEVIAQEVQKHQPGSLPLLAQPIDC